MFQRGRGITLQPLLICSHNEQADRCGQVGDSMEYAVGCKQNSLERKDELVKMQLAMAVKADKFRNMGPFQAKDGVQEN